MLSMRIFDTEISTIIYWFFLYSFIGWTLETIVISVENNHFTNRGFLHGPFCIVHGVGALAFYFILRPFSDNYALLFFGGVIIATSLEFVTAKIMIKLFGAFWWDYSKKRYNYKGILCLESSIAWGALTVCLFAFIHRLVTATVSTIPVQFENSFAVLLLIYLLIDFSASLYQVVRHGQAALPENALTAEELVDERFSPHDKNFSSKGF